MVTDRTDDGGAHGPDPAHAPGKRRKGPAPHESGPAHGPDPKPQHHQPWVPAGGLVGRKRRSQRRG